MNSIKSRQAGLSYQPVHTDDREAQNQEDFDGPALLNPSIVIFSKFTRSSSLPNLPGYTNAAVNPARKIISSYSPILDRFDLMLRSQAFNGALRDNLSIWRQPPSPAVDAAWDYISGEEFQVITVSASDVLLSGKDPSTTIQAPASWGDGPGAYIAQVEVFHQIHCLNELRKEMHRDYYYNKEHTSEIHRKRR
ncbi:hypothetical protein VHEMI04131 [[Torrubiella] hemipterigena]|uniref:Uncharacterized protein n=1 Tax=[Torrubiella] hemipterigena TaxID=1531966 RepID=A0A0A1TD10_9HYPO|nr:hypothetical protein VHEMI04131 [[Torrubiella] hemipterigena]